jgi:cytochrome b6-f complex iron-sulfur subunit
MRSCTRSIRPRFSLDAKEKGLWWRNGSLIPVWAFAVLFFALMYRRYLLLRRQYVRAPGERAATPALAGPTPTRRWLLDTTLRLMGGAAVLGLLWPAVTYILPARKRGGGAERASAGKEEGWKLWEERKIALAGQPAAVIRTADGFRALSLVCTHLGCIVHWNEAQHEFLCPCHGATFGADGRVVSGPPPKPLPEYSVAVIQGEVIVAAAGKG